MAKTHFQDGIVLSDRIRAALASQTPVVALESTIIAHGLPWPDNMETAMGMESAIRVQGAEPATIGIIDGRPTVGLSETAMERLARGESVLKTSRRDLGFAIAAAADGATTVSATMILAHAAGIRFFATGGIGGVHRGGMGSFDVSADLGELGRTPVAVICSGAKNILDLPATLECLETLGVPVVGFGTDDFPAFHVRSSGLRLEQRVDTPDQAARILAAHWGLGLTGGVVIANPIPEEAALDAERMEGLVAAAVARAKAEGIAGKALTPYLLQRLAEETGGDSLKANKALAIANAQLGGRIAVALNEVSPRLRP